MLAIAGKGQSTAGNDLDLMENVGSSSQLSGRKRFEP